jgi:aarF domain-containing kinase
MQLFSELDYVREATNGERFRALYGNWENIRVPASCLSLTRKNTLVTEWIDGEKGDFLKSQRHCYHRLFCSFYFSHMFLLFLCCSLSCNN